MKLLKTMVTLILLLAPSAVLAAVDNHVLKDGVKALCEEYGGVYWDGGHGRT